MVAWPRLRAAALDQGFAGFFDRLAQAVLRALQLA
jgi:hypothetical protein